MIRALNAARMAFILWRVREGTSNQHSRKKWTFPVLIPNKFSEKLARANAAARGSLAGVGSDQDPALVKHGQSRTLGSLQMGI
jgi:hypothetical protein